ncbi:hypothetical protein DUI87_24357 [Hirundo rustica rustica]|uniref:Uncharacterized protein n=1 Tax=Hirundo rustica rustica TaxID=333673 RepID=A0A3M0JDC3_HIRRU|nr:hypothetical protein DUI87_24357 [Hirundo rustica rustica]
MKIRICSCLWEKYASERKEKRREEKRREEKREKRREEKRREEREKKREREKRREREEREERREEIKFQLVISGLLRREYKSSLPDPPVGSGSIPPQRGYRRRLKTGPGST